jgi:sulfoacetaldehyde dehydrogenase
MKLDSGQSTAGLERSSCSSVALAVERARLAQSALETYEPQAVNDLVSALGWSAFKEETARSLSELAVRETGLGKVEDTYLRYRQRIEGILCDLKPARTIGVVEINRELGLRRVAKPVGVVAAITPATAPAAAVLVIALIGVKTRNAVIVCPNPRAQEVVKTIVHLLRQSLEAMGAPPDILQCIENPTREIASELMAKADLVIASGSRGTVARAYSSGSPAYGAGDGNAVVVIDETSDLPDAAKKIIAGKAFDNGTSCSSESCAVIAESIYEQFVQLLIGQGAHLCDQIEASSVRRIVWPDGDSLSHEVVGQSAMAIAKLAGISVPEDTRVLLIKGDPEVRGDPVSKEKLSPVLGIWKYCRSFDHAVDLVNRLTLVSGRGHSCGIFSRSAANIERIGAETKISRVMVNQSTCFGNTGSFENGMPFSVVLSCGTWGGSTSTENISWRHFLNYTWVSEPIARNRYTHSELFGRHWLVEGQVQTEG